MYFKALLLVLLSQAVFAKAPDGGGAVPLPQHDNERTSIEQALKRARIYAEKLNTSKGPVLQAVTSQPELHWPVRKSIIVTDADVQAISGFVDHDPAEGGIQDYDCGERTYDGHRGLDISLAPYPWYMMERDNAIVVAAAAGTIVEKVNDQPERSCKIDDSGGDNNLVVIEQQDGSLALYAHMRTGSATAKGIGDNVTTGEYLGVVGSAGMSTGPHLHFEIGFWELNENTWEWKPRDPFAGTCNGLNAGSWWEEQPAYRNPLLNGIATHTQAPEFPDCPETERPHYSDSFMPGDTVFLSAYYRDQLMGLNSHYKVTMPNGVVVYEWDHASTTETFPASMWYWSIELPSNAPGGEYTFIVTFEGQTVEHKFYVNAGAAPPPVMPTANNAYNGAWYDPTREGEGYNILTTSSGTVIYFYGSDSEGKRFWLISEVVSDVITTGQAVNFVMYESTGGSHSAPISSARGLSVWGELTFNFSTCDSGTAFLRGLDGEKSSSIVKVAGVAGTICVGQPTADGPLAGAWFDFDSEGEGFNMIVTPGGAVVYYYGFDKTGDRLWFISDLIQQTLTAGQSVLTDVFKATAGTFDQPVPSEQALEKWGSLRIAVTDCNHIAMTMNTSEGLKISSTFKVASVVGLTCTD